MKKVLIAEDEEVLLNVLKDRFEAEGWEVFVAKDGEEAVAVIKKTPLDLVLLDLLMPKKDGFEVLKEVRGNPELKNLPIVVLSNLGGDEDIKKALTLGANDYYVKTQHPMSEIVEKAKKYANIGGQAPVIMKRSDAPLTGGDEGPASNQGLADYIKESRAAGAEDEEIKKSLLVAGWNQNQIESALK